MAATAARTPVARVGSSTGKKRGEWFFAGLSSSAAAPPKNQNMLGTSMESARWPKSSEPINGGVSMTLSSSSFERRDVAARLPFTCLFLAQLLAQGCGDARAFIGVVFQLREGINFLDIRLRRTRGFSFSVDNASNRT